MEKSCLQTITCVHRHINTFFHEPEALADLDVQKSAIASGSIREFENNDKTVPNTQNQRHYVAKPYSCFAHVLVFVGGRIPE